MLPGYHPQVKRRLKLTHLTFVDFLEVLTRARLTVALTLTATLTTHHSPLTFHPHLSPFTLTLTLTLTLTPTLTLTITLTLSRLGHLPLPRCAAATLDAGK